MSKLLWIIWICWATSVRCFLTCSTDQIFSLIHVHLQMPDPEPSLLENILHSSNRRSRRSLLPPRDLPFGRNDGHIKRSSNPSQIYVSLSGLHSYLRSRFALHLPWFWYLWKETHSPSVLPGKEPPGFWTWMAFCSYEVQWRAVVLPAPPAKTQPFGEPAEGISSLPQ